MPRYELRFGKCASVVVGTVAIAGILAAGGFSFAQRSPARASTAAFVVSDEVLSRALASAGLSPDSLAACGANGASVATLFSSSRSWLAEHGTQLSAAWSADRAAGAEVSAIERRIQSGRPLEGDVSQISSKRAAAASARAAAEEANREFFEAAAVGLGETVRDRLWIARSNQGRGVPIQYRVVNRTDEQWALLRDACSSARISAGRSESPDGDASQLLADASAQSEVVAAKAGVESNLAQIKSAWTGALAQ